MLGIHSMKNNHLFECLLVLLQMFLPRYSQEPKLLPLADQLTELWSLGVKVLQGNRYSRLQLQSTPPLWMQRQQHRSLESAQASNSDKTCHKF